MVSVGDWGECVANRPVPRQVGAEVACRVLARCRVGGCPPPWLCPACAARMLATTQTFLLYHQVYIPIIPLLSLHFPSYIASPSRVLAPPSFPPNIVFTAVLMSLTPVARGHWMETHQGRESRRWRRRRWWWRGRRRRRRRRRRRGVGGWTEEEGWGKTTVTESEERYYNNEVQTLGALWRARVSKRMRGTTN